MPEKIKKYSFVVFKVLCTVFLLAVVSLGLFCLTHMGNNLTVSVYSLETNLLEKTRIVQLSDLHCKEFGEHNSELIETVLAMQPDIIVMTGDMLNKDDADYNVVCELINSLSSEIPVYYCPGNHEIAWLKSFDGNLYENLKEAGAVVLDCEFADVTVNSCEFRIGGYMGYYGAPHLTSKNTETIEHEEQFMQVFENTDRFKILLDHIPTSWTYWNYIDNRAVDLVLCGHYHGGMIRLPIIGALYAPYEGWFPEKTDGIFIGLEAACVLSRGLGNEHGIPRINNPPEIVVVDLIPAA